MQTQPKRSSVIISNPLEVSPLDNPAGIMLGVIAGLLFGVPIMAAIMYGSFRMGCRIYERHGKRIPDRFSIPILCLLWAPMLVLGWLIPGSEFARSVIGLIVYLMNAYPCVVGYVARRTHFEEASKLRYRKNVDDWLGDWECRIDEEDRLLFGFDEENPEK